MIAALFCALAAQALAQGLGLGLRIDDVRRNKAGAPAAPSAILVNTGVKLLANTGVVILVHN